MPKGHFAFASQALGEASLPDPQSLLNAPAYPPAAGLQVGQIQKQARVRKNAWVWEQFDKCPVSAAGAAAAGGDQEMAEEEEAAAQLQQQHQQQQQQQHQRQQRWRLSMHASTAQF